MKHWLEKAINRYLALDPESEQRIALLQDKVVTVEMTGVPLSVQLLFADKTIQLKWQDFIEPDLVIRGTPLNLLHMSLAAPDKRQAFFAADVVIEGNMELAQHVLAIFAELEIDWEDYFSRWMGDVPAYQSGRFVREFKKITRTVRKTFTEYVNEYCHEEINVVPPVEALQDFFKDVDELRLDVERLAARVAQLKQKVQDKS